MPLPYCRTPCAECPWRRDAQAGKFPTQRYVMLASTAYDMAGKVFACHMTKQGKEVTCAGYILSQGAHNMTLRMARQTFDVHTDAPLFRTYRELAIHNGVEPDHPALKNCRDDGQTNGRRS